MKSIQGRFFPRKQCAIPIEHSYHRSHHYHDSIVYNKSIFGLYFETANNIEPERIVHISVKDQPLLKEPDVVPMYFKARAKWCRPGRSGRYGVGAQLLEARSSIDAAESFPIEYGCDLCGRRPVVSRFANSRKAFFFALAVKTISGRWGIRK
jgi:hypothetical protein